MLPFMLLAAQAAGIGMSMYAERRAEKFARIGEKLDILGVQHQMQSANLQFENAQRQLDTRMQEEQLAFSQQALFDTERLREVMATQRAIFSARGQMPGVGSAGAITNKSLNAFGADERARNLSKLFAENKIKSGKSLLKLQQGNFNLESISKMSGIKMGRTARKAQSGANLMMRGMNMFSFNAFGENPFGSA